jgi:hypothetical protein
MTVPAMTERAVPGILVIPAQVFVIPAQAGI